MTTTDEGRIPDEELLEMLGRIEAEEVDDSEEILDWFAVRGPSMIRELLRSRGVAEPAEREPNDDDR